VTSMRFIRLDIHKKTITYCVKDVSGTVLSEGTIAATRAQLDDWVKTLTSVHNEVLYTRFLSILRKWRREQIRRSSLPSITYAIVILWLPAPDR
jgi:hypothetical protein